MRVFAAVLMIGGAAAPGWAAPTKVEICHLVGSGGVIPITVAAAARPAHLAHGDYLPLAFYADADGDGFGDPDASTTACVAPEGMVGNDDDCDDGASFVNPDATDACGDSVDEDCSGDDALCSTEKDGWTVTAGRVEPGPTAGTLVGTFAFAKLSGSAETRGGGGCLLADQFSDAPFWSTFVCTSDADCAAKPRPAGGAVYCASPDGSGEQRRCWTRPSNNCSRDPARYPGEFVIPPPGGAPIAADAGQTPPRPVRWMVIGCLAFESDPMGCAKPGLHVYSFGPVYTWRPAP